MIGAELDGLNKQVQSVDYKNLVELDRHAPDLSTSDNHAIQLHASL